MERYNSSAAQQKDPTIDYKPFQKHTADSKWQFCDCQTCQEKRARLDRLPGPKVDFATFRNKDERY